METWRQHGRLAAGGDFRRPPQTHPVLPFCMCPSAWHLLLPHRRCHTYRCCCPTHPAGMIDSHNHPPARLPGQPDAGGALLPTHPPTHPPTHQACSTPRAARRRQCRRRPAARGGRRRAPPRCAQSSGSLQSKCQGPSGREREGGREEASDRLAGGFVDLALRLQPLLHCHENTGGGKQGS